MLRVLGEEGGVLHRLTGSERTAYQFLKSLKMVPAGGSTTGISGPELLSLTSLARTRRAERGLAR